MPTLNLYRNVIVLALIVAAFIGVYFWGHHSATVAGNLKIAQLQQSIQQATLKALSDKAATELAHQNAVSELTSKYEGMITNAQAQIDDRNKHIADGSLRLSVPAAPVHRSNVSDTYTSASTTDAATRCDIDPAAAQRLVDITDEGDSAIRQLNALEEYVRMLEQNF